MPVRMVPWFFWAGLIPVVASANPPVNYTREIRPILSNYCYQCHGPDAGQRKEGLRLDLKEAAFGELASGGHGLVAGNVEQSAVAQRIASDDPDVVMPPRDFGKKLSATQIELVQRWVAEGAKWEDHWAYTAPKTPTLPAPKQTNWVINPIDAFVLERLERDQLAPSSQADRVTLFRRLTFDLTGLPPTPAEVDEFLADTSPQAYENAVQRLLESPRYGEHMSRYWLDAARYGDTHGLHLDNYRSMWPYRNWVIAAFQNNMPFNRFTVEQLAGDLLPNATLEQRIASGFNRCNVTTSEGGSIDEEYYVRYTIDRVETTATVFMGVTLGCAVCHDHKYDPFTQREFYQFFAYFNNLTEKPMDGNKEDPPPVVKVADDDQRMKLISLDNKMGQLSKELEAPIPEVDAAQTTWEAEWSGKLATLWRPATWSSVASQGGASFKTLDDGTLLVEGTNPAKDIYTLTGSHSGAPITALKLECFTHESFVGGGPGRSSNGNFVLSEVEVEAVSKSDPGKVVRIPLKLSHADFAQKEGEYFIEKAIDGVVDARNGWAVAGHERHENRTAIFVPQVPITLDDSTNLVVRIRQESEFGQHAIGRFKVSVSSESSLAPTSLGHWHMVGPFAAKDGATAYASDFGPETDSDLSRSFNDGSLTWVEHPELTDGASHPLQGANAATYLARTIEVSSPRRIVLGWGSDDALKVWLDGKVVLDRNVQRAVAADADQVTLDLTPGRHLLLAKVVNYESAAGFTFRVISEDSLKQVVDVAALLSTPAEKRSPPESLRVRDYYRSTYSEPWRTKKGEFERLDTEKKQVESSLPPSLVMQEMDGLRQAYLLVRGEYDKRGDSVVRGVPAIFPPLPKGSPDNRLGLAQWITDPNHPLTARVTVNRFWQQFFGTGLVKTSEDFGVQGEYPSHPELLDWLATDFVSNGWDVKRLVKMIVMSSTYRQSSAIAGDMGAKDPENRLLARGPRYRYDAEVIRDNALAISGLLVERVGGPSVKPYQPPGIWEAVAYPSSNTANFTRDTGDALYRRSLYTFWKRTAHPPAMQTFDAPSREQCAVRRARTNTPLQALVLMNDEQFVEASRAFAQRILREGGTTDDNRLRFAFRSATARTPTDREMSLLREALADQRSRFTGNAEKSKMLTTVGESKPEPALDPTELAPWTMIGNLILNLHETITKG